MNYRVLAVLFVALSFAFAGMGFVSGQDMGSDDKKDEAKDVKEGEDKDEGKEEDEKPKPMSEEDFHEMMEETIKDNWNRLKINHRKKMGDRAAEAAEKLKETAPKILLYDGEVLDGKKKGEKAREQKDFKEWVEEFEEALEDYAKEARDGEWEDADELKDKISDTCTDCHDKYEPVEED